MRRKLRLLPALLLFCAALAALPARASAEGWEASAEGWRYLSGGEAAVGWLAEGQDWYYFDEAGLMQTGWFTEGSATYYAGADGRMVTGWQLLDGDWYYFYPGGAVAVGWLCDGGTWYLMDESGRMRTGWVCEDGTWYYLMPGGAMATGWFSDGTGWYYAYGWGAMATGWVLDGGAWYYLGADGRMATGWLSLPDGEYYLDGSGAMQTGSVSYNGGSYWLEPADGGRLRRSGYTPAGLWADGYGLIHKNLRGGDGSRSWQPGYYLKVNVSANTVTAYSSDSSGSYTVPERAMVCSTGSATPLWAVYRLGWRLEWQDLFGSVFGHYVSQINGNILFHSVPYLRKWDPASLEYWEFDKLGSSASMGCVRLQVKDAKWIFDNHDSIVAVEFYQAESPGPLGKPSAPLISDNVYCRDWDPTDPDPRNPWLDQDVVVSG